MCTRARCVSMCDASVRDASMCGVFAAILFVRLRAQRIMAGCIAQTMGHVYWVQTHLIKFRVDVTSLTTHALVEIYLCRRTLSRRKNGQRSVAVNATTQHTHDARERERGGGAQQPTPRRMHHKKRMANMASITTNNVPLAWHRSMRAYIT